MSSRAVSQLFVGRLDKGVRQREVEDIFSKYGPLNRCDVKYGTGMAYAFIDFEDNRDAEDAIRGENNRDMDGERIVVEWARGPKKSYSNDECYNCGKVGHFARECRSTGGDGYRGRGRGGGRGRGRGGYSRSSRNSRSRSRERRSRSGSGDRRRSRDSPQRRSRSRSRSPARE